MLGRVPKPLNRLRIILWDASAVMVITANVELCYSAPLFGGFPVPIEGLPIILRDASAVTVTTTKVELC